MAQASQSDCAYAQTSCQGTQLSSRFHKNLHQAAKLCQASHTGTDGQLYLASHTRTYCHLERLPCQAALLQMQQAGVFICQTALKGWSSMKAMICLQAEHGHTIPLPGTPSQTHVPRQLQLRVVLLRTAGALHATAALQSSNPHLPALIHQSFPADHACVHYSCPLHWWRAAVVPSQLQTSRTGDAHGSPCLLLQVLWHLQLSLHQHPTGRGRENSKKTL